MNSHFCQNPWIYKSSGFMRFNSKKSNIGGFVVSEKERSIRKKIVAEYMRKEKYRNELLDEIAEIVNDLKDKGINVEKRLY
ncbi:MAG: hypothetical protein ACTSQG_06215 [Promethearchaeota archaeon]